MLAIPVLLGITRLSSVAIDLPDGTPPETVNRVVESCNQALGSPRCHAASPGQPSTTLLAVVSWEGADLKITLYRESDGEEVDRRHVAFSEADAPSDRYIAAGLLVAALTAAHGNEQTESPPPEAPPAPSPPPSPPAPVYEPAPPPIEPAGPLRLGMDLEVQAGQGLSGEQARWGGGVRLWWLENDYRIGVTTSAGHLRASKPVELAWTTLGAGVVARPTPWSSLVGVEISAEAVAQHTEARAERRAESRSASLWRLGGRLSSAFVWEVHDSLKPYVGLQLTLLERGFQVTVQGEPVGSEPEARVLLGLGLKVAPF